MRPFTIIGAPSANIMRYSRSWSASSFCFLFSIVPFMLRALIVASSIDDSFVLSNFTRPALFFLRFTGLKILSLFPFVSYFPRFYARSVFTDSCILPGLLIKLLFAFALSSSTSSAIKCRSNGGPSCYSLIGVNY